MNDRFAIFVRAL